MEEGKRQFNQALACLNSGNFDPVSQYFLQGANQCSSKYNRFKYLHEAAQVVSKVFSEEQGDGLVDTLRDVVRMLRKASIAASSEVAKSEPMELTIRILQSIFPSVARDRSSRKKPAAMTVTVELFRIYFSMNNLRLCKNLIRTVEMGQLPDPLTNISLYPRADSVTYAFYAGRIALLDSQFDKAETLLGFAYSHCHKKALTNKKAVLKYLVPIRMLRGILPREAFLKKNDLGSYAGIARAVRTGNMQDLNEALETNQVFFIREGVYLLLERLRPIVFRTLLRRVFVIGNKNTRVSLDVVDQAAKLAGVGDDSDENECIVANLIYQNLVKGYIAHQRRILVLAATNPFPALSTVRK